MNKKKKTKEGSTDNQRRLSSFFTRKPVQKELLKEATNSRVPNADQDKKLDVTSQEAIVGLAIGSRLKLDQENESKVSHVTKFDPNTGQGNLPKEQLKETTNLLLTSDEVDLDVPIKKSSVALKNSQKLNLDETYATKKRPRQDDNDLGLQVQKKIEPSLSEELLASKNISLELNDVFWNDDWGLEESQSKLDFGSPVRCKVEELNPKGSELFATVKSLENSSVATVRILPPWSSCPLQKGNIVNLCGTLKNGEWVVDENGFMILHCDMLIPGTTLLSSLFCNRKTVLNHLIMEENETSTTSSKITGILVHELLQEALLKKVNSFSQIRDIYDQTISSKDFIYRLFTENVSFSETVEEMSDFLPSIRDFMQTYVATFKSDPSLEPYTRPKNGNWSGEIVDIEDIEENIRCPQLGIKGQIDATVKVKIHSKSKIMPLELKTGKVSMSVEHRGQVILYCMMMSQLGTEVDSGLLLYLRDGSVKKIKAGASEKRDLLMLRNQLVANITAARIPSPTAPLELPRPISHSFCPKCDYYFVCTSALKESGLSELEENHSMRTFIEKATLHLKDSHIKYVFHMMKLVLLEKLPSWTYTREKQDQCLSGLHISGEVEQIKSQYKHIFTIPDQSILNKEAIHVGQYMAVSSSTKSAITNGSVTGITDSTIELFLYKNLSSYDPPFSITQDTIDTGHKIACSNLAFLLTKSPKAASLRETVIDMKLPVFQKKLSSKIQNIGRDIFRKLNSDQIRAILQVLSADKYILIKGMPGTGKTSTVAALVELLVRLGKTVLITSHTHSAVDNILLRLVGKVDFLRLGKSCMIHPDLGAYTEKEMLESNSFSCAEDLETLYNKKAVVGVTCLGSQHFLFSKRSFDICIVDEATQVDQPTVLRPLTYASKFVLVGDPEQLPPLVVNPVAKEHGLGISMFERLHRPAVTSVLSLQYRMNKRITELANSFSYNGLLKCGNSAVESGCLNIVPSIDGKSPLWLKKVLSKDMEDSVVVLDVKSSKEENSCAVINYNEANLIVHILQKFKECGVASSDMGVISPYRAQVGLFRRLLSTADSQVEVNTVDQYQGRDKLIIIYSCTRSMDPSEKDILNDSNRLTVAVTRAKVKLIIVGDVQLLKNYSNFNKLLKNVPSEKIIPVTAFNLKESKDSI